MTVINGGVIKNNGSSRATNNQLGIISVASDFPTISQANLSINRGNYLIAATVTDNDPTKTDTGQSFTAGQQIYWTGIAWVASDATLPIASATILGGIKVGNNLTIEPDGTLNAVAGSGAVDSVNDITPDESGNVSLEISDIPIAGNAGNVPYIDSNGKLTTENALNYDAATNTLDVNKISFGTSYIDEILGELQLTNGTSYINISGSLVKIQGNLSGQNSSKIQDFTTITLLQQGLDVPAAGTGKGVLFFKNDGIYYSLGVDAYDYKLINSTNIGSVAIQNSDEVDFTGGYLTTLDAVGLKVSRKTPTTSNQVYALNWGDTPIQEILDSPYDCIVRLPNPQGLGNSIGKTIEIYNNSASSKVLITSADLTEILQLEAGQRFFARPISSADSTPNSYTFSTLTQYYSGGGGGGVSSISGNIVDNTDPSTPSVNQVQSDWNASGNLAEILNKPIIGSLAAQDSDNVNITGGYVTATAIQGALVVGAGSSAGGSSAALQVYPSTAAKGLVAITTEANSSNTTTTMKFQSQAGSRIYSVPDSGEATDNFVLQNATQLLSKKSFTQSTFNFGQSFNNEILYGEIISNLIEVNLNTSTEQVIFTNNNPTYAFVVTDIFIGFVNQVLAVDCKISIGTNATLYNNLINNLTIGAPLNQTNLQLSLANQFNLDISSTTSALRRLVLFNTENLYLKVNTLDAGSVANVQVKGYYTGAPVT